MHLCCMSIFNAGAGRMQDQFAICAANAACPFVAQMQASMSVGYCGPEAGPVSASSACRCHSSSPQRCGTCWHHGATASCGLTTASRTMRPSRTGLRSTGCPCISCWHCHVLVRQHACTIFAVIPPACWPWAVWVIFTKFHKAQL